MNILSWKVVLFLKKHAADGGFTRNGIAVCMDISPIGLLRVLRMLVKKGAIRRLQQRNRPTLYLALKESA